MAFGFCVVGAGEGERDCLAYSVVAECGEESRVDWGTWCGCEVGRVEWVSGDGVASHGCAASRFGSSSSGIDGTRSEGWLCSMGHRRVRWG